MYLVANGTFLSKVQALKYGPRSSRKFLRACSLRWAVAHVPFLGRISTVVERGNLLCYDPKMESGNLFCYGVIGRVQLSSFNSWLTNRVALTKLPGEVHKSVLRSVFPTPHKLSLSLSVDTTQTVPADALESFGADVITLSIAACPTGGKFLRDFAIVEIEPMGNCVPPWPY